MFIKSQPPVRLRFCVGHSTTISYIRLHVELALLLPALQFSQTLSETTDEKKHETG